ncbi:hypothetical protein D8S78_01765 [Natrialba swarupiae]|nr:hypothetical protein [Natrialba swarupiae]
MLTDAADPSVFEDRWGPSWTKKDGNNCSLKFSRTGPSRRAPIRGRSTARSTTRRIRTPSFSGTTRPRCGDRWAAGRWPIRFPDELSRVDTEPGVERRRLRLAGDVQSAIDDVYEAAKE